ncbi:MAG: hypothetical protein NUK62_04375 [Tenericutes bacterium]|nr:hypothetical protein [Mycoplasmatota bacterium]
MSKLYILPKGLYYIGDPGLIIKKNKDGDLLSNKLYEIFYKDMNNFQKINLDGLDFYITRTASGDGMFNDIGTDTGLIIILETNQLKNDERFIDRTLAKGCHYLEVLDQEKVTVTDFNIVFDSGYQVLTNL